MTEDHPRAYRSPLPGDDGAGTGFVPLIPWRRPVKLLFGVGLVLGIALVVIPIIVIGPARAFDIDHRPLWIALTTNFCLVVGLLIFVALWSLYFRPSPEVNWSTRSFKIRRNVVPFAKIDTAIIRYQSGDKTAGATLIFGQAHGTKASIKLTPGSKPPTDGSPRAQLVEAFRESSIQRPKSPYDPEGAFARYNFPDFLDKDAAIAVIENPPYQFSSPP